MVTSDRIAVMREGRLEQVGTAREIYERPATAFVAGFIGRANLLRGRLEPDGHIRVAEGLRLRVADARGFAPGTDVAVSVRPHRVAVLPETAVAGARERGWTVWAGTVTRVVYFGDSVDLQVAVPDGGPVLRLAASPDVGLSVGQAVSLGISPDAGVVLPP
jgi:ABC-type Fe3+/spermidine/putrescine transport system ATPase subunit